VSALVDGGGRSVFLGTQIGKGGEATISAVAGRPELVAKIWHEPASAERAGKLRWMLAHPPADPAAARGHVSIPWPCSPVSDETGALRGFLMPRLAEARPLFEVFNPARRRVTAPGWDGRYLFRAARNLASVVAAIHEKGYVVGDLNESNVLVAPTALVSVVDTDSFQVRAVEGGREVVYPCRVGKPR
jgi:DNA-binding helix-hairpin-helix protein with protein kinase domain